MRLFTSNRTGNNWLLATPGCALLFFLMQDAGARAQEHWPGISAQANIWPGAAVHRITYGNGMFLAVGLRLATNDPAGGVTATSPDGLRWTAHAISNTPVGGDIMGVAPANGRFAAFGYSPDTNGFVQYTTNGTAWSQPVMVESVMLRGLVCADGLYVGVGWSYGTGSNQAIAATATSRDGANWSRRTFPGYGLLNGICAGAGRFVAVGQAGTIFTSADGSNWLTQTVGTVGPGPDLFSVAYGNGIFVAASGDALSSSDGTNWTRTVSGNVGAPLAFGNGLFVSALGGVVGSTNGTDWASIWALPDGGGAPDWEGVAYGAGAFEVLRWGGGLMRVSPGATLAWSGRTNGVVNLMLTGGWLGQSCRLQANTNLLGTDWIDLLSFTNQGSLTHVQDIAATNQPRRLYRVAMP